MSEDTYPKCGEFYRHTNGNVYQVMFMTNAFSENHDKYPPTVVYSGSNGRIWSRPVSDWSRSMTLIEG